MKIENLLAMCAEIGAKAPASFWAASDETLARAWNGIGPEHWPKWMRGAVSALLRPFSAAALIHDWEFSNPVKTVKGFTAANARLTGNIIREAIFDCHPALIPWGIAAGVLCEIFGWRAYKEGKLK